MKIVYCIDSMGVYGGIERVTALKANALSKMPGNEVWILCLKGGDNSVYYLESSIMIIDIGVSYNTNKKGLAAIFGLLKGKREHKARISELLSKISPDIVVSTNKLEKTFLPSITGTWKTVREIHEVKNSRMKSSHGFINKVLAWFLMLYDSRIVCRKYDCLVLLSETIKKAEWGDFDNTVVIPNPVSFQGLRSSLASSRVIAIGRLSEEKNFSALIRAFRIVANRFPQWSLDIWGDGDQKGLLSRLILDLGLSENVHLCGITSDTERVLSTASLLALSSTYESFGLVIAEAMSCGLPVVSFDCPYGPRSIIDDGIDGFLVPDGDEGSLAEKICVLIKDEGLRKKMGTRALVKSRQYDIERISDLWMSLFEELTSA